MEIRGKLPSKYGCRRRDSRKISFKFPSKFLLFYDASCVGKYISSRQINVAVKLWLDFTSGYIGNIICCGMTHSMTYHYHALQQPEKK